jgi:predicted RNA binding protein YcfA (HicA-like mRNA interferase family)
VPTKGKDLVKEFQKAGWSIERISGSHHIMVKETKTVSIPVHGSKELGKGLENKLRKQLKD